MSPASAGKSTQTFSILMIALACVFGLVSLFQSEPRVVVLACVFATCGVLLNCRRYSSRVPCKYGDQCLRKGKGCRFMHAGTASASTASVVSPGNGGKHGLQSGGELSTRAKTTDGDQRPAAGIGIRNGVRAESGKLVSVDRSKIQCRYDQREGGCTNEQCPYKHEARAKAATVPVRKDGDQKQKGADSGAVRQRSGVRVSASDGADASPKPMTEAQMAQFVAVQLQRLLQAKRRGSQTRTTSQGEADGAEGSQQCGQKASPPSSRQQKPAPEKLGVDE